MFIKTWVKLDLTKSTCSSPFSQGLLPIKVTRKNKHAQKKIIKKVECLGGGFLPSMGSGGKLPESGIVNHTV